MEIGDWPATVELNNVMREARRLGIERNLLELEAFGFTVIEPEQLKAQDLCERMLAATLRVCEEENRSGNAVRAPRPALAKEGGFAPTDAADRINADSYNRIIFHLHARDPVYLEAFTHPVALTVARYLLGASCVISGSSAFVKRGQAAPTFLHIDTRGVPPPLNPLSNSINMSWVLTDYTQEGGTFAFVPGSHRYFRHPTPGELPKAMGGNGPDICIPCGAKAGSLIAFGNNMWHGTFPKANDDLRVHIVTAFCRPYVHSTERTDDIPESFLRPYEPEIHKMLGSERWTGYGKEGADPKKLVVASRIDATPSA